MQIWDLAVKLPTYKANLTAKVQTLSASDAGPLAGLTKMLREIEQDIEAQPQSPGPARSVPVPVEVIEHPRAGPARLMDAASTFMEPLASAGVIVVLAVFILFKRDDLRDRIIGLIGKGHIGETTRVMGDAARRVIQFLRMNLLVNALYGVPVAIGLWAIGVPGALVFGLLATVLRFIPYLGPLIAMALPIALSLAVFDNWTGPLLTVALFVVLELIINNLVEPWLYASSTGISSFALIVAALFWTWLWGSVGLILSTPLTVCLLVLGKHVPQFSFLGVLLSEEGALESHELVYHRLLAGDTATVSRVVNRQLKSETLGALHGLTLLPALGMVEDDMQRRTIDSAQHRAVLESMREIVDQLEPRAATDLALPSAAMAVPDEMLPAVSLRIVAIPAETLADEIAAAMLAQAARSHHFEAEAISSRLHLDEIRTLIDEKKPDYVWLCAVNPRGVSRSRYLCVQLRKRVPDLRISVGVWYPQDHLTGVLEDLKQSGAESVATVFSDALVRMEALRSSFEDSFTRAPLPNNEADRLNALVGLGLLNQGRSELFDRTTTELTKIFDVPIALVSIIDADWQHFASQCGLPTDLATEARTSRDVSVCGHVVAANRPFVIEDLARDRRFAGNPLLRKQRLRFYAGVPLRTSAGQAIGSLCILDTRPRTISEREVRLMQMIAEGLMMEVEARTGEQTAAALPS